jgi:glycosyltransferase involved in cell wall biosynthesis
LAQDKTCFLFGADHGGEKRKGFAELAVALNLLPPSEVQFASFGEAGGMFDHLPVQVKSFGRISSDQKLATIYAAADAFLLPSLEDNLPNMIIESMACGTPVIGFDAGGIPDLVTPETGVLVRAGDSRALADAIRNFKPDAQRALNARALAAKHSPEVISRRHLQLYGENRPAPRTSPGSNEMLRCLPPGPAFTPVFESLWQQAQKERPGQWWRRFMASSQR